MIKLFAFDIFGTLVDMKGVPHEELKAYGEHIRKPEWSPLVLPESWRNLQAFDDAGYGISSLTVKGAFAVTLSNAPLHFQLDLWGNNWCDCGEWIDAIIPLEMLQVFKPNIEAYKCLFRLFPHIKPSEMCMVTANEHFGDIEAARSLGMQAVLIRGNTGKDVTSLVEMCK